MVSVFLGLLTGVALFLLNIILKFVVKALKLVLGTLTKQLKKSEPKDERFSEASEGIKKVGSFTANVTNFGLSASILAIKALLRVLQLVVSVLTFVVCSTWGLVLFVILPLCLLVIALIVSVAVTVTSMDIQEGQKQSGYSAKVGISSYRYMDIDWSQDFSEKLDIIEATYGKDERDVLEWVIVCMNTQQNIKEAFLPVEGYCVGNIVVESGGSANLMGGAQGHPSSDYTLRNAEEGVEWQYASGDGSGKGYPRADGAFQIITSGWVGYNPLYADYSSKLSPPVYQGTDWHRLRYYCPTVAYGTLTKYMGIVSGDSYEFKSSSGLSAVSHAFQLMGVEETSGRYAFVKNACLASYAYGSLVDSTHASREDAKHDLATNIALFVLAYCETYMGYDSVADTYTYTARSTNLSSSIVSATCGTSSSSLLLSNSVCKSVFGTTGKCIFSESVYSETNFGVLDKEGSPISGTLDGYLLHIMPEDAKLFFESTCADTFDTMTGSGYGARGYYDISMLVVNNYLLETSVNLLGLKVEEIDSDWMKSYQEMGIWYANNINTYCSYKDNSKGTMYGRTWYSCPLLGGKTVGDDCSAFVTACLANAGYLGDFQGGWGYGSSHFKYGGNDSLNGKLASAGFAWVPYDSSYVPQSGDIAVMDGHVEIIGGYSNGIIYRYTWGNNYSVMAGKGLPASWDESGYFGYWSKRGIIGFWRKIE